MPLSEKKKASNKAWDKQNMAYQTFTVRRSVLDEFKRLVQLNGDKVNTLLRTYIERYISDHTDPGFSEVKPPRGWTEVKPTVLRSFVNGSWQLEITDDGDTYGAWLAHADYSGKMLIFGVSKANHTLDNAIGLAFANVGDYYDQYKLDFMD